ncbi:MAG TPA: glycosyltransferase [Ktedonobacteraceae bacterium]|nr:glycosyltransferase [Ktedonobacteraceae bacterium]
MTIESGPPELESSEVIEQTEKLVSIARQKYLQKRQPGSHKHEDAEPLSRFQLSVVIPTRNEQENIRPLLEALHKSLADLAVEVIFVDDSDDSTPDVIKDVAETMNSAQFQICLEHRASGSARSGGLATAVVHGMDTSLADYVAVIDADLQHPPEQLRLFYEQAIAQQADLVVASRYIKGGSYRGLESFTRRCASIGLKQTARLLFPAQLWQLSDPLGGFFLLRRELLQGVTLRPIGYKILLEILLRCPWLHIIEYPYHFRTRAHGQSKASLRQGILTLQHMLRLWREVPAAGRIWKIGLLLCFNVIVALSVFLLGNVLPTLLSGLTTVIFVLIAILDFLIFRRFILPSLPPTRGRLPAPYVEDKKYTLLSDPAQSELIDTEPLEMVSIPLPDAVKREMRSLPPSEPLLATKAKKPKRFWQRFLLQAATMEKIVRTSAILIVLLAACWISYALPGALLVLAAVVMAVVVLFIKRVRYDEAITMVLALAVGIASIDYLSWRFVVANWHGWWISVPLLFAEFLGALHALGFQVTVWPWLPPTITQREDPTRHPIYVFIPTVNEGVSILRPTLEGIIAARDKYLARYPHGKVTIVVCNDGRVAKAAGWEETEKLAQELGVVCVTRTVPGGAKAGNIENARQQLNATSDAFLVIFDADQVARPDFLLKTIPPFSDPQMGWVQTGQYYANLDNPVSRWADDQQSMFYNLLCPGKAALNAAFICGTNVVIRAAALDQIGGLPQNSVTEDFAASIALHPTWRSVYLTDVLATGLGPLDVPSFLKQQRRWAIGTLGIFRTHWREIFLPRKHGLRMGQRIQYFLACTHYLCGLRDLIYLISPILFIFTGVPAVRSATLGDFFWHFMPYCILSFTALWYSARDITGLRGIIIGFGSFPVLIESLLSVVLSRKVGFSVTSKQRNDKRSLGYLRIYSFFFLLCIACLIWATQAKGQQQTSLFISVLWVLYSMVLLASFIWLSFKDVRFQDAMQKSGETNETVANQPYPVKLLQRRRGLQPIWCLVLAVLFASPILLNTDLTVFSKKPAQTFMIERDKIGAPYFGVSVPVQLLKSGPAKLENDLDTQFTIVGRTQDIHDSFDTAWAEQLAAQHAHPWITLQFGVFGPHQKPPLDANLPAIINGLHDPEITRWAQDIRSYGEPVYITILQHADRNWSLSSGVANGGIPQDVSQAWIHMQDIFHKVGANNVAWVWAPADPLHSQPYDPPAARVDAVLQSFINYPGTTWGDPTKVLHTLQQKYPQKPIFVEASVSGPAAQKAAWLTKLEQAVNADPHVYALLYHEGGPDLNASQKEIEKWSLASDPKSLAAMRHIAQGIREKTDNYVANEHNGAKTKSH